MNLKVIELFGGIGAPRKALENLNINYEIIDYVEIDENAVKSYNSIFNDSKVPKNILDYCPPKNKEIDLLVHGSPCVDFSIAGKNDVENGKRSILYKESIKIISDCKPKFIIWENVKNLISKKHIEHFEYYLETLEKLGYRNKYKILNGINFGIPQKRERVFVVSIRNDIENNFSFDNLEESSELKPLSSFLEKNVDEKYYINQKSMIQAIKNNKIKIIDNIASTVTTKQWRWNNAGVIKVPFYNFEQENYVYDANNQNVKIRTITAAGANSKIKIAIPKNKNKNFPIFLIENKHYQLRILTEKECWRLMGFSDEDSEKAKLVGIKKTILYKQAGNSIIIPKLEAIFKELFIKNRRN